MNRLLDLAPSAAAGELEASAGVSGGCRRGRIEESAGEASTGMPPVVPNDSLERAPSGRGSADDTPDDRPVHVGWGGRSPLWDS